MGRTPSVCTGGTEMTTRGMTDESDPKEGRMISADTPRGHRARLGWRHVAVLAAIALVAGGIARLAYAADGDGQPIAPVSAYEAQRDLGGVASIFDRAQTAEEARLGDAAADTAADLGGEAVPGENLALQRRVEHGGDAAHMVLWPADDSMCFAFEGAASCVSAEGLAEAGIAPLIHMNYKLGHDRVVVGGAAADGISAVSIERNGTGPVTVDVRGNGFLAEVDGRPTALRFNDAGGVERELKLDLEGHLERLGPPSPEDSVK
jgi:hypothetical protein